MPQFIIDFLPATRTKHHENRFPPVRKGDDEMAMNTQNHGSVTGGPVYSGGGHMNDSDGSERYYQAPQGRTTPSQNF